MLTKIIYLIIAHAIGDYFLQTDYLAKNKGTDFYILFIHCVLYCVPFIFIFGITWQLAPLFVLHLLFDWLKASKKKTTLLIDQIVHYATALLYLV
jgi:hypothetical protein